MKKFERKATDFNPVESFFSSTCPSCGEYKIAGHWLCLRCTAAENPFAASLFKMTSRIYGFMAESYILAARVNRRRLEKELSEKENEN